MLLLRNPDLSLTLTHTLALWPICAVESACIAPLKLKLVPLTLIRVWRNELRILSCSTANWDYAVPKSWDPCLWGNPVTHAQSWPEWTTSVHSRISCNTQPIPRNYVPRRLTVGLSQLNTASTFSRSTDTPGADTTCPKNLSSVS